MPSKRQNLKRSGTIYRTPERVKALLFESSPFFDKNDLVQVKYEMVRQVSHDASAVSVAAKAFGFSRPSLYKAKESLEQKGLAGLVPKKPGPKQRRKMTQQISDFARKLLEDDEAMDFKEVAQRIKKRFAVLVHPRSIKRALMSKKKPRSATP